MQNKLKLITLNKDQFKIFLESRKNDQAIKNGAGLPKSFYEKGELFDNTDIFGVFGLEAQTDNDGQLKPNLVGFSVYMVSEYNRTASFSMNIRSDYQKKGFGQIIHDLMVKFLFETIDVRAIYHYVLPNNLASRKIIEKYPFNYIGPLRECSKDNSNSLATSDSSTQTNGKPNRTCLLFELTKNDYFELQKPLEVDPQKSYGIHDRIFKESEKKRLSKQLSLSLGSFEKFINNLPPNTDSHFVDLGSGTGDTLARVRSLLPNAQLTGIDLEGEFVSLAKSKYANENITFIHSDFLQDGSIFEKGDYFYMRLVGQHIGTKGLSRIMELFKEKSPPKAKLIITDVDDRYWVFEPPCYGIESLLRATQRKQQKYGGDRFIGLKIPGLALKHGVKIMDLDITNFNTHQIGMSEFFNIIDVLFYTMPDPLYISPFDKKSLQDIYTSWKDSCSFAAGGLITCILTKD